MPVSTEKNSASLFAFQVRVYWEDTDGGGIVYHANYLRFLERARTEWLRARGLSQCELSADPGIVFSVVALEAQYRRAARLDDLLAISCELRQQGGATIVFSQRIWRSGEEAQVLLSASVRVACLDARTMKPRRLPPVIVRSLTA